MSDTLSRRGFIAGVASAAGAAGLVGCGSSETPPPQSPPSPAAPPAATKATYHDDDVAADYCGGPRQLLDAQKPLTGVFLYGLMCAAVRDGDVLMPVTEAQMLHRPRLYTTAATTATPDDGTLPDGLKAWDLGGCLVRFVALDANDKEITALAIGCSKKNRHERHPWVEFSSVRNLPKHANKPLIQGDARNNPKHVACRVSIPGGHIEPAMPYSPLGKRVEWAKEGEEAKAAATTDTLLWVRGWPPKTEKIRVDLIELGKTDPKTKLTFALGGGRQAVFAITHAMKDGTDLTLDHTRAYGHLVGLDPANYPVPKAVRGCYGETDMKMIIESKTSSRDGHCEVSYDG